MRYHNIDIIKIVAMLGVIALHTTHDYIRPDGWGVADIIYETAVVSIPLFFMASGYLLLGREYHFSDSLRYAWKKILNIFKFVALFSLVYNIVVTPIYITPIYGFHPRMIFKLIFYDFFFSFIQRGELWFFWYLGSMIIIYIAYPFINHLYLHNKRGFYVIGAIMFFLSQCIFTGNLAYSSTSPFEGIIWETFRLHNWFFYFILGSVVRKIEGKYSIIPWICLPILTIGNVIVQGMLNPVMKTSYCEYHYASPLTMLLVFTLFYNIASLRVRSNNTIAALSGLFLPVYSLHIFVLRFHSSYAFYDAWAWAPLFNWAMVAIITIFISFVLMKIPLFKRLFTL